MSLVYKKASLVFFWLIYLSNQGILLFIGQCAVSDAVLQR